MKLDQIGFWSKIKLEMKGTGTLSSRVKIEIGVCGGKKRIKL